MEGLIQAEEVTVHKPSHEKYQVTLADWTGPYDVLLKVIEEQEMDLLDLNISVLLEHYLEFIQGLEVIDIDEAGEFLLVAATLAQIKSKLLLPKEDKAEEEAEDPRAELVRYLQEYQKIKKAAEELRDRPLLGRDVFMKGAHETFQGLEGEGRGKLFQLVKGFQKVLRESRSDKTFEVTREEINVGERIRQIHQQIKEVREIRFEDVLREGGSKSFVIASFLAILELVRMKNIRILQADETSPIFLVLRVEGDVRLEFDSEFDLRVEPETSEDEIEVEKESEIHGPS